MKKWIIAFLLFSTSTWAVESDICDILDLPKCRGITKQLRRNTFQSAPNSSTASNINPSNTRFDKGLGIEAIAQSKNQIVYGLVTGTGKLGGALISGSLDNTFFGNRTPELDEVMLERLQKNEQYENEKFSTILGARLLANKKFGLDAGVIIKRHKDIRTLNPGAGVSARIHNFHFGASVFRDDHNIDLSVLESGSGVPYSVLLGKDEYRETFTVNTWTAGVRLKKFSLDVASISSNLKFYKEFSQVPQTRITIYALSYYYENFLFNLAVRNEKSGAKSYKEPDQLLVDEDKAATFFGVQYLIGKHLVVGLNYNYFLLREWSASMALFF